MNKSVVLRIIVIMLILACLTSCKKNEKDPTEKLPDKPPVSDDTPVDEPVNTDSEWARIDASCFTSGVEDFEGEIDGVSFKGVLFESDAYQPRTYLTKKAVKSLRIYARENGYDGLRIHTHVNQTNNAFVIGDAFALNGQWTTIDISLANLYTFTPFWSQSEGTTENYIWFEFIKLPVINATSFTNDVAAFSGTVGGETFDGFVFKSAEYQPTTYFTGYAIEDIQNYAKEKGFNALRIHAYPIQMNNAFVIGGQYYLPDTWTYVDFSIADMTAENMNFWSQSEGATENYMWFEFVNSDNPVKPGVVPGNTNPYFRSDAGVIAEDFSGEFGGESFDGIRITGNAYQPYFYFSDLALSEIKKAAEKNGMNFLRIHSYSVLTNNGLMIGDTWTGADQWYVTDVAIEKLNSEFSFWSQSEGSTEVYLWFEMYHLDIPDVEGPINASFFKGVDGSIGFSDYQGLASGTAINGIKIGSVAYQPHFRFTAEGIKQIKAYSKKTGKNFLTVHSYAILYNNGFVIGNAFTPAGEWRTTQIQISKLDESFDFWSQSEGATEIYLWFEWEKIDVPDVEGPIDDTFFEGVGSNITFVDYAGEVGGNIINGVQIKSVDYQPYFRFTAEAIEQIKAYAEEEGKNVLNIHSYAILYNNGFIIDKTYTSPGEWRTTQIQISNLDENFMFWSQSEGATEIYLWFEYAYVEPSEVNPYNQVVHAGSFTGSELTFEDFQGEIGGTSFIGVKATSNSYQPHFNFTDAAISEIKAYAEANSYDTLTIHAYANLYNNCLVLNNQLWVVANWSSLDVAIADLTSNFDFWSQSEGTTEVYLWFEFSKASVINSGSFTGSAYAFENFTGEIGGTSFSGVKATSNSYQPHFNFTDAAISEIKAYAEANSYDTLTIHAYANLYNNCLVLNNQLWVVAEWNSMDVTIADLTTSFDFWSQSEGATEVYLWFEFSKASVINSGSFMGSAYAFENFTGEIGGTSFTGVKATSNSYQPHFNFTDAAISEIKAYAEANSYDTVTIHAYAKLYNNCLVLNNQLWVVADWSSLDVAIADLTSNFDFWSQSEGATEVYLWFEFSKASVINSGSFMGSAYAFENFTGEIGGTSFTGVKATSNGYQPHFNFTDAAISAIKAYAEMNGYDTVTIHAYANLYNNCLVLNNQLWVVAEWKSMDVTIADLTTSFDFWSQSEGATEAYLWFEFSKSSRGNTYNQVVYAAKWVLSCLCIAFQSRTIFSL